MIKLFSGTPGSGKSYHAVDIAVTHMKYGRNVITNFPMDSDLFYTGRGKKKKPFKGKYIYMPNDQFDKDFLIKFALENHKKGVEGSTTIIIDEAQQIFNPREFQRADRMPWNNFFSIHRHMGYNVILVTQNDRLLDRQIRCLIEYEFKHKVLNNHKWFKLLPFKCFIVTEYWHGLREKLSTNLVPFKKSIARYYDSYTMFTKEIEKEEKKKKDLEDKQNEELQDNKKVG